MAMHPAYKNSSLVSKAAMASRLIVTTSSYVSKTLQNGADNFTQKTKPNSKPMTFTPTTHARIRKVHTFSEGAAGLSAKTVGSVSKYAQNLGATLAKRGEKTKANKGIGPDGQPIEDYRPSLLNKSMMAFSTIADGIDQAGRNLLAGTSSAATTVVAHKYGPEAGEISKSIAGGFKNVGLVYIDAAGVSRKAIVKSVAKGMVVGKMRGGGDLVVGGGDGGVALGAGARNVFGTGNGNVMTAPSKETENWKEKEAREGRYTDDVKMSGGAGAGRENPDDLGYGKQAPPAYMTRTASGSGSRESFDGEGWEPDWKR
jgi:spartin